jgi:hypothetical protein
MASFKMALNAYWIKNLAEEELPEELLLLIIIPLIHCFIVTIFRF